MDIRLVNVTDAPFEIDDGLGGRLVLKPGVPTQYPGDIAGADLRKLIAEMKVRIKDVPGGPPPVEHD